jgi:glycerol-3-phosphate dehydrogenase
MRPLVKPVGRGRRRHQGAVARAHRAGQRSGLVTVTGGKWTTYRAMAEDVLQRCMARGLLPAARVA